MIKNNYKRDKMAIYVYSSSLFYKDLNNYAELSEDDFEFLNLPIISKDMYVKSRLPIEPMEFIVNSREDDVVELRTSGSTGKCLMVEWNKDDYVKSMIPLWLMRKKYYDINTSDKMCYFYTIHNLGNDESLEFLNGNTLGFSKIGLNKERIKNIYLKMLSFEPKYMLLQPSIAEMLLDVIKSEGLPPINTLKYVEMSGEMLSGYLKKNY